MWILSYWVLPVISATMWLGMLIGMFLDYITPPRPLYPSVEAPQTVAYISDVGAFTLKPLFITGSIITTIFLDLSFFAERYLRHKGRLARNTSRTQKTLSTISIIFAVAGSVGLILLAVFDTYRYPNLHNIFLLVFMASFVLSAIFICAEYQRLGIHYRQHRILRLSFWLKLAFILVEIAMAVAFGITTFLGNRNMAAIMEWVIALIFTGYIVSFVLDLWPSVRTKGQVGLEPGDQEAMSMPVRGQEVGVVGDAPDRANGYRNGVNGYFKGRATKPGWMARWRN